VVCPAQSLMTVNGGVKSWKRRRSCGARYMMMMMMMMMNLQGDCLFRPSFRSVLYSSTTGPYRAMLHNNFPKPARQENITETVTVRHSLCRNYLSWHTCRLFKNSVQMAGRVGGAVHYLSSERRRRS